MNWISVKDELPPNSDSVLAHIVEGPFVVGDEDSMMDIVQYYKGPDKWIEYTSEGDLPCTVSHWMPLPAIPEEYR